MYYTSTARIIRIAQYEPNPVTKRVLWEIVGHRIDAATRKAESASVKREAGE